MRSHSTIVTVTTLYFFQMALKRRVNQHTLVVTMFSELLVILFYFLSQGYIATRLFSRNACFIMKIDEASIPELQEIGRQAFERQVILQKYSFCIQKKRSTMCKLQGSKKSCCSQECLLVVSNDGTDVTKQNFKEISHRTCQYFVMTSFEIVLLAEQNTEINLL